MNCPNPECKKNVEGMRKTLYGKDGLGGLVHCIGNKVSRKGLIATWIAVITILSGIIIPISIYGLEVLKKDRAAVSKNKEQIISIDKDLEHIKKTVEKNQKSLEEIKEQISETQISPKLLKKFIKEAIKEGNNN